MQKNMKNYVISYILVGLHKNMKRHINDNCNLFNI